MGLYKKEGKEGYLLLLLINLFYRCQMLKPILVRDVA